MRYREAMLMIICLCVNKCALANCAARAIGYMLRLYGKYVLTKVINLCNYILMAGFLYDASL